METFWVFLLSWVFGLWSHLQSHTRLAELLRATILLTSHDHPIQHFDKVPEHLRVGPWTRISIILPIILTIVTFFLKPENGFSLSKRFEASDYSEHRCCLKASSYPEVCSVYWWYNVLLFIYMTGLLARCMHSQSPFIIATFTIQSWTINSIRYGLNALAPLLSDGHFLLHINRILRFPAILSSAVVFLAWNFILVPFFYVCLSDDTKRKKFMEWNIEFRMVQLHVCNIVYSIMNTLFTQSGNGMFQLFRYEDFWYGLVYWFGYGLFYILFLDRIGAHLYPVFSPRANYSYILWFAVFGCTYGFYILANAAMAKDLFSLPILGAFTICITIILESKSGSLKKSFLG